MNAMPTTAMVLAAGLGARMRPLTDDRPKPLINVAGKALIDYALDRFADAGVKRAVVNVHYLPDMVERHVASRTAPEIIISDERGLLLETGGGLKKAATHLGSAPIFCTNTDAILVDEAGAEACATLASAWNSADMDALLLLVPMARASGYGAAGDFDLDAEHNLDWRTGKTAPFVFTGLQILSPKILDGAPDGPFSTRLLWEKAKAAGRFKGVLHKGDWMHVGDPEGLKEAEARLARLEETA